MKKRSLACGKVTIDDTFIETDSQSLALESVEDVKLVSLSPKHSRLSKVIGAFLVVFFGGLALIGLFDSGDSGGKSGAVAVLGFAGVICGLRPLIPQGEHVYGWGVRVKTAQGWTNLLSELEHRDAEEIEVAILEILNQRCKS